MQRRILCCGFVFVDEIGWRSQYYEKTIKLRLLERVMLFRAIRAYNQLESENEAIRTKAEEDLEAMTANKTVRDRKSVV